MIMRRLYFNRIKYLSYDGGVFWSNFHSMKQTEGISPSFGVDGIADRAHGKD